MRHLNLKTYTELRLAALQEDVQKRIWKLTTLPVKCFHMPFFVFGSLGLQVIIYGEKKVY